jgi:hypothetical protein
MATDGRLQSPTPTDFDQQMWAAYSDAIKALAGIQIGANQRFHVAPLSFYPLVSPT